jgi:prepilin-type N-terminal cleavage/methylation domain-containing protein
MQTVFMKVLPPQVQKGFSLVEMLVAIAIFMIVVTTTLGAFLKMVDINKKVQSVRNAMDNANLAMETMMRNIRLGYDYNGGGSSISFTSQNGESVTYSLMEMEVDQGGVSKVLGQMMRTVNGGAEVAITSPDLDIDTLRFVINGGFLDDNVQAHVNLFVTGKTVLPKNEHNFDFSFQSLATQRLYDK